EYKILTSKGIQKRFLEAVSRRKDINVILEYLLIDLDNDYSNLVNVNINSINDNRSTQSKVKKSKVKKSKEYNNKKNDGCCDDFDNDLLNEEELSDTKKDDFKVLANLYQKCGFTINGFTPEWIKQTLEQYGFEWFKNAILLAEKHDARSKSYVETILTNWNTNGGMDLGGKKKPQKPKGKKVQTQFHNFEQRTTKYSADELEAKVRKKFENKISGM
ncbi:hypothetical protein D3Z33_16160, partial [Senegalia massiliensis]|nr:hypothetical protein [Senegalia massiliensis]